MAPNTLKTLCTREIAFPSASASTRQDVPPESGVLAPDAPASTAARMRAFISADKSCSAAFGTACRIGDQWHACSKGGAHRAHLAGDAEQCGFAQAQPNSTAENSVELHKQQRAAGIRRHHMHGVLAILSGQRIAPYRLVVREVGAADQSAVRLKKCSDGLGNRAPVESLCAKTRDLPQCVEQRRLSQNAAAR